MSTHILFFQFSCGHEYFTERLSGGSDWENCLCDSCQPYDGVLSVEHPCCFCGGSLAYLRDGRQTRLSEAEAKLKIIEAVPLFGNRLDKEKRINASQSS